MPTLATGYATDGGRAMAEEDQAISGEAENVISGDDAHETLKLGQDGFNKWAADNPETKIDLSRHEVKDDLNCDGFIFRGEVDFSGATFHKSVSFKGAEFSRDVSMSTATFSETATFRNSTFNAKAYFLGASFQGFAGLIETKFLGDTSFFEAHFFSHADSTGSAFKGDPDFSLAKFDGGLALTVTTFQGAPVFFGSQIKVSLDLSNSKFTAVPYLKSAELPPQISLHGMTIGPSRDYTPIDEGLLCKLRELASSTRDHDREQYFFAHEVLAARKRQDRVDRIPGYLYEWCSNFGRSVWRPVFGLLGIWLASAALYACFVETDAAYPLCTQEFGQGMQLSASMILPFLAASRYEPPCQIDGWLAALAFTEGLLGLVMIFLIGLALRNRFRI